MALKMYQGEKTPLKEAASIKYILGIAAGKGGVGKSTLTVNLARALKKKGYTVGVLDTDIYGPSIRRMLPEDRLPGRRGDKIIPALSQGIRVVSFAHFRKENEAAAVRAPIANGVIKQFLQGVEWGSLDFLLIDFPPGTGDIQLTLSQQANLNGALMVTTPQEVSIMDVKKAMSLFDSVKIPVVGIIENMSYYQPPIGDRIYFFGKGGGERLALDAGLPFLGQIPLDEALCASGDNGFSLFEADGPSSPSAESITKIADSVVDHLKALQDEEKEILPAFELAWKEMES